MNLPPWLVNAVLRVFVRWPLGRIKTPQALRERFERDARFMFRDPEGAKFNRHQIRREDGSLMPALWASRGRPDRQKVVLYLHGGAYLAGSPNTHRHLAAQLAGAAGVRCLLPDYRLAPEAPFPAAVEDALTAYRHLLESVVPRHIAIAGDSAGGGLVFGLLLRSQAEGLPMPAATVAFSPFADLTLTADSLRRNARREVMLPAQRAQEAVDYYLAGHDPFDPLASPVFGEFDAPPPALIMASTTEILSDHAKMLAKKLREAGGDVQLEMWPGLPHAWPILLGKLKAAETAVSTAGRFIAAQLSQEC
ncbi:MAG: alpha/beta hydrolase [Pseudomonadota bacterium]